MRQRPLCGVPANICMFSRILWNAECFPGHFVKAFVVWISSEALKAVILMHWCSHAPPTPTHTHTHHPHTHTPPPPPGGLILKRYSLTDVRAASLIRLAGKAAGSVSATTIPSQPESRDLCSLELTQPHFVCESKRTPGNKLVCVCVCVCVCKGGKCGSALLHQRTGSDGVGHIVFVSFPPKEHTPSEQVGCDWVPLCVSAWNHWGMQLSLCPTDIWANNWEHKRGARGREVCVCVCVCMCVCEWGSTS